MNKQPFFLPARIKSFKYAFAGLKLFFKQEHNARIHLCAAIFALALSFFLKISGLEWIAVLSVITLVLVAEIINTAIEQLADVVSTDYLRKLRSLKIWQQGRS